MSIIIPKVGIEEKILPEQINSIYLFIQYKNKILLLNIKTIEFHKSIN